ncbi:MAG: hypothetical protein II309_07845 [Bacilli bacterium]|jgi:hypothetical protein|nr:hypothetical protein [Bacilli bacterium]
MSNGFFIKSKKNMEIIKDGILKLLAPCILLFASFIFLTGINADADDQMFMIIKYAIYALDFVALVIAIRVVYGMLYDLDIIKSKIHRAKVRDDD